MPSSFAAMLASDHTSGGRASIQPTVGVRRDPRHLAARLRESCRRAVLARPAGEGSPLRRAAELVLRTSCIGEALTVPILKRARADAASLVIQAVLARILVDESAHAELGAWLLDWAEPRLDDGDRAYLGAVGREALESFAPIFTSSCTLRGSLGIMDCAAFDAAFDQAVELRVIGPLKARGIDVRWTHGQGTTRRARVLS